MYIILPEHISQMDDTARMPPKEITKHHTTAFQQGMEKVSDHTNIWAEAGKYLTWYQEMFLI
jgi:hypothetical protein